MGMIANRNKRLPNLTFEKNMPTLRCPICKKSIDSDQSKYSPFCCERCKQIDLGRWLDERYGLACESPESSEIDEDQNPEDI
jgi:uncharacterized protein